MFVDHLDRNPRPGEMGEFYPVFAKRNLVWMKENGIGLSPSSDEAGEVTDAFMSSEPYWASFEDYLSEVKKRD